MNVALNSDKTVKGVKTMLAGWSLEREMQKNIV
jgi:hypothetical protein